MAEGAGAGEDVAKSILKCLSETFEVQLIERHQLNSIGLEFRDYGLVNRTASQPYPSREAILPAR